MATTNGTFFSDINSLVISVEDKLLNTEIDKIVIHGNALHTVEVVDVIKKIELIESDIEIELELFDDGSAEYKLLYDFALLPISEQEY